MQIFNQFKSVMVCGTLFAIASWAAPQTVTAENSGDRDRDVDAILPLPGPVVATTVPSNGDVNPYGVVFAGADFPSGGKIHAGDVLVSNFNNSNNLQGTGTTIVDISPAGKLSLFFQGQKGLGLSTALGLLREGLVVVGNFPSSDGSCGTATAGSLLFLNRWGNLVDNLQNSKINGPWDMAVHDEGDRAQLFVTNALPGSGGGTVVRLDVKVESGSVKLKSVTQIGSGYMNRCDPAAFVVGPTGLVYDAQKDTLYVASTEDNAIYAIRDAKTTNDDDGKGTLIYRDEKHLHGPLAMAMAPNGHLIVSNSDVINPDPAHSSELTEFTIEGKFVAQLSVDPSPGGSFGLAFSKPHDDQVRFAAVDDNVPNITIWSLRLP